MNCIFASKDNMWSNLVFKDLKRQKNVNWIRVTDKKELQSNLDINPDWVFFFHWSHIVSESVWKNFCHMFRGHQNDANGDIVV